MSKILDTNNLLDAASELDDPELEALLRSGVENAVNLLALALAKKFGIELRDVSDQGSAFGGLCATFKPAFAGQECPEAIDSGDPDGDWED
jgi:hypothetical protein